MDGIVYHTRHPGFTPPPARTPRSAVPVPARRWAACNASAALGSSSCGARASLAWGSGGREGGPDRTPHTSGRGDGAPRPRPPGGSGGRAAIIVDLLTRNTRCGPEWSQKLGAIRTAPTRHKAHCHTGTANPPTRTRHPRRRHNMPTSHEPIVTSAHADPFGTRCDAPSVLLSEVGARWRTPSPN